MGATVTVGCKLPHGLVAEVGKESVTFLGINSTELIGGHGITENVPKDFWDAWVAKVSPWFLPLKNGVILWRICFNYQYKDLLFSWLHI